MHNLFFFFCSKIILHQKSFLIAVIDLTTHGPLYTCLVTNEISMLGKRYFSLNQNYLSKTVLISYLSPDNWYIYLFKKELVAEFRTIIRYSAGLSIWRMWETLMPKRCQTHIYMKERTNFEHDAIEHLNWDRTISVQYFWCNLNITQIIVTCKPLVCDKIDLEMECSCYNLTKDNELLFIISDFRGLIFG